MPRTNPTPPWKPALYAVEIFENGVAVDGNVFDSRKDAMAHADEVASEWRTKVFAYRYDYDDSRYDSDDKKQRFLLRDLRPGAVKRGPVGTATWRQARMNPGTAWLTLGPY